MEADFFNTTIGEQITLQRGFDITKKQQQPGDVPVVSSGGISSFHNESKVQAPGVVLGRKGSLGTVFYLDEDYWPHDTTLWVKDFKGNNQRFVYYFFRNMAEALKKMDVGAANPALNRNHVHLLPTKWPKRKIQDHIDDLISVLDDKIQLNRQTNQTLEAMAQALFKSWFVDFDPVIDNALATGHEIPPELQARAEARKSLQARAEQRQASLSGDRSEQESGDILPESIRQLFPNRFVLDAQMGWIPEGWEVKPFGDLLESTVGGDWGKEAEDDKHAVKAVIIRGTDIPDLKLGGMSSAPTRWVELKKLKTRKLEDGDIVIEVSGGSPKQPTGRALYINQNLIDRLGGIVEPASFCRRFKPKSSEVGLYAAQHLQKIYRDGKMWEYQNQSTGISNFQTKTFLAVEMVVMPDQEELIGEFFKMVRPLVDKATTDQQVQLAKLRDTLLPKLISGELRLPDEQQPAKTVTA